MNYTEKEKRRLESYKKIHLNKKQWALSIPEQIQALEKKDKNKWFHVIINIVAIGFFGYSYLYDVSDISDTLLLILAIVFILNMGLIFYQKKQIKRVITYLENQN